MRIEIGDRKRVIGTKSPDDQSAPTQTHTNTYTKANTQPHTHTTTQTNTQTNTQANTKWRTGIAVEVSQGTEDLGAKGAVDRETVGTPRLATNDVAHVPDRRLVVHRSLPKR